MRVLVTGGTGFVGYHTAATLMDAGYEVRLLVRSEEKMRSLFADRSPDFCVGDVTDDASVERALDGMQAVVHTAAMVSVDRRDAQRVQDTNMGGTRRVIGGGAERGLDTLVHVSSVTALYNPDARFLNEYSPPGSATNAYGASKVASEVYVRELQDAGAPVHITYPASVIGPGDPGLTEPHQGLMTYLESTVPVGPSGNQWVDVRDIALAHQALLERNLRPGRFPLGGHYLTWAELVQLLESLTGRQLRRIPVPGRLLLGLGRVVDWLNQRRGKPLDLPLTHEGMTYATNWVKLDSSKAQAELGVNFRPVEHSLADAIRSLVEQGHLAAEKAGRLAEKEDQALEES